MIQPELQFHHIGEGVKAFSSTRHGGYSKDRYGEFNINCYCGDDTEAIRKNRQSLCRLLSVSDDRLFMPHQVLALKKDWTVNTDFMMNLISI